MDKKKIDLNLKLQELKLNSLSVEENMADEEPTRINGVKLLDFDENNKIIEIKYNDKLISNAIIHLELKAVLEVDGEIDLNDLEKIIESDEVDDLVYPLLAESSHIISFLTSKTDMFPIIIPPTIMRPDNEEDINEDE